MRSGPIAVAYAADEAAAARCPRPGHAAGNVRGTCSRSAGLLLDEEERSTGATDGRLVVDEGLAGNADRLLDRLRAVHGGPV